MGGRRSTVQLAMCHTKTRFVVCGILLFASRAFALPVYEAERVQRTNGTMAAVDPVIAVLTQTQQDEDTNTGDSNELEWEVGGRAKNGVSSKITVSGMPALVAHSVALQLRPRKHFRLARPSR